MVVDRRHSKCMSNNFIPQSQWDKNFKHCFSSWKLLSGWQIFSSYNSTKL